MGSIRAGLVFQVKEAIGSDAIMRHEASLAKSALESLGKNENIKILGSARAPRLAIISFAVAHKQTGLYLHYKYVTVRPRAPHTPKAVTYHEPTVM